MSPVWNADMLFKIARCRPQPKKPKMVLRLWILLSGSIRWGAAFREGSRSVRDARRKQDVHWGVLPIKEDWKKTGASINPTTYSQPTYFRREISLLSLLRVTLRSQSNKQLTQSTVHKTSSSQGSAHIFTRHSYILIERGKDLIFIRRSFTEEESNLKA